MAKLCRALLATVLLAGTGCCGWWDCCCRDCCYDHTPPRVLQNEGPPRSLPPPEGAVPQVAPRPGTGAYGGTGP